MLRGTRKLAQRVASAGQAAEDQDDSTHWLLRQVTSYGHNLKVFNQTDGHTMLLPGTQDSYRAAEKETVSRQHMIKLRYQTGMSEIKQISYYPKHVGASREPLFLVISNLRTRRTTRQDGTVLQSLYFKVNFGRRCTPCPLGVERDGNRGLGTY